MADNPQRPTHLPAQQASTWDRVNRLGQQRGVDPTTDPVLVTEDVSPEALEALAAVGGADITQNPEGAGVLIQLRRREDEGGAPDTLEQSSMRAAAQPHSFA